MQRLAAALALNVTVNLVGFVARLREAGLPVGTAELLDAFLALQHVDLSDRSSFKAALAAALVKQRRHVLVFEQVFDLYFIPEEVRREQLAEADRQRWQTRRRLEEASRSLQFKGEPLRLSREEMLLYTALPEEQRRRLLDYVRRTEAGKNVEPGFKPLLETVVKSHLRYWREKMHRVAVETGEHGAGAGAGEGAGRAAAGERLRRVDMGTISEADLPLAEALLRQLARRLARKIHRRRERGAQRGPLDLRRSLRANLCFGGTVFRLHYRRRRPSRRRLLLLCDVSASMQRYSAFVLRFIYGLQAASHDLEFFSFADSLEHLSPALRGEAGLGPLLERVVEKSANWGGGTNLGVALEKLLKDYRELLNSRTAVLVVSDTRTVALEPSLQALRCLKERVRSVIWLNPLPLEQWAAYRSVAAVGELVEMWPCSTIEHLERLARGRLLSI